MSLQQESKAKGLSPKELKQKLIQVVKTKGIYDSMKVNINTLLFLFKLISYLSRKKNIFLRQSQLRNKLVLELNPNNDLIQKKSQISLNLSKSNLALNTVNCLILNHFKTNEYDYTLSVFMPECGMGINEVLIFFLQFLKFLLTIMDK